MDPAFTSTAPQGPPCSYRSTHGGRTQKVEGTPCVCSRRQAPRPRRRARRCRVAPSRAPRAPATRRRRRPRPRGRAASDGRGRMGGGHPGRGRVEGGGQGGDWRPPHRAGTRCQRHWLSRIVPTPGTRAAAATCCQTLPRCRCGRARQRHSGAVTSAAVRVRAPGRLRHAGAPRKLHPDRRAAAVGARLLPSGWLGGGR